MNAHVAHDVMTGLMHAAFRYFNSNDNKSKKNSTKIFSGRTMKTRFLDLKNRIDYDHTAIELEMSQSKIFYYTERFRC